MNILTKACKIINNKVHHHRPISRHLLEVILFECERMFINQPHLDILYKTVFLIGYFVLFRVCELASDPNQMKSNHAIKACNVHIGQNKEKLLFVLYTSKTHRAESLPQKVKIKSNPHFKKRGSSTSISAHSVCSKVS